MNEKLNENALNDDNLEQVTGGKTNMKKNNDCKGKKITAVVGTHAAMEAGAEAEADVKGYAEATGRIW